ncbi:MAG: hypothetical protein Q4G36_07865 [Paracoccus sp. (in: a-proteobacteria)]|nr:hypothetical protein [Paracoccus sp. (in: a-proteobacteria)]
MLFLAAAVFVGSSIAYALQPIADGGLGAAGGTTGLSDPVSVYVQQSLTQDQSLLSLFLQPRHAALWMLLVAVWLSVLSHAIFALQRIGRDEAEQFNEEMPLIGALLIGAVWPWMIESQPVSAVLGSLAMLAGLITVALRSAARGRRIHNSPMIGVFSAWVTMVAFSALGMLLVDGGASVVTAASLVLLFACAAGGVLQLQIQGNGAYTITLIFAFLGVAAAMLETSPMISIAAVMAIAAMTFVLVDVTT